MAKGSAVEEGSNKQAEAQGPGPDSSSRASQFISINAFSEIAQNYQRSQEQAWLAARRRVDTAERRYADALQELQDEVRKQLTEAYQQGLDAWAGLGSDVDAQSHYQDVQRKYLATTGTIYEKARGRFEDHARTLNEEVTGTTTELNEVNRNAYREYLRSLQGAWARLDVDAVVDACAISSAMQSRF